MKNKAFYPIALIASFALIYFAPEKKDSSSSFAEEDYQEECQLEGCSAHEVEELYESYDEECRNEGCSREEVIELGGTPLGAQAMLAEFNRRGYKVNGSDFQCLNCSFIKTSTKCIAFVFLCKDHYQCSYPCKPYASSWYVCGGCFGVSW